MRRKAHNVQPNIQFCLDRGVITPDDLRTRLAALAANDPKVEFLAREFSYPRSLAAEYCFDAGIAFMRVCILAGNATGMLSPARFADAGWDSLADHEESTSEWAAYVEFCERLCVALETPLVIPRHVPLSAAQAVVARDLKAIGNVIDLMRAGGIHFVEAHWPTDGSPGCHDGSVEDQGSFPPCTFAPAGARAA